MSAVVQNRKQQLESKGFFTSNTQKEVFDLLLDAISKSSKFESIGNAVLIQQMVQKTQVELINNLSDLFSEGWMLVKYFKHYAKVKDIKQARTNQVWSVINAINLKDRSKFNDLFVKQPASKKLTNISKPALRPKNWKPKDTQEKVKPEITYLRKKDE